MASYVYSDIHGNFYAWIRASDRSGINLENGDNLVILGDLIDKVIKAMIVLNTH